MYNMSLYNNMRANAKFSSIITTASLENGSMAMEKRKKKNWAKKTENKTKHNITCDIVIHDYETQMSANVNLLGINMINFIYTQVEKISANVMIPPNNWRKWLNMRTIYGPTSSECGFHERKKWKLLEKISWIFHGILFFVLFSFFSLFSFFFVFHWS